MKFVLWLAGNALALLVAIWFFHGITLTAETRTDQIVQLLLTGGIFGAINSLVKPAVKFLSFPFIILSLGLLLLVINAAMLLLTSAIAETLNMGFHVDGFWTAVFGSIVISLVGMAMQNLLSDK